MIEEIDRKRECALFIIFCAWINETDQMKIQGTG